MTLAFQGVHLALITYELDSTTSSKFAGRRLLVLQR